MTPVDDMTAFFRSQFLMQDRGAVIFDIASVAADHSVQTDIPDILIDFCFGTAGADISFVSVLSCHADGFHSGEGWFVKDGTAESSVNVNEQYHILISLELLYSKVLSQ
jgi:hypothetical protein